MIVMKENYSTRRHIIVTMTGMVFGYFIGVLYPYSQTQYLIFDLEKSPLVTDDHHIMDHSLPRHLRFGSTQSKPKIDTKSLPPSIVVSQSDLYLRRMWGDPSEDLKMRPKYLVVFTAGLDQRDNINAAVKKFSDDFQILLFHYDGRTTEWDQFEWSRRAVHISVGKQAKWWYAKRFLHPDIVADYEYIFIWDEDLGLEHFDAHEYIELVKKHGLEISQPGLERSSAFTWQMTRRRADKEVHKVSYEKRGWCEDIHSPPCAAFVEIMAPVFSREAWRCVWHMIQNDLVHGWGLDFALKRCVEPAHEKIGIIDAQWIVHQEIPSLAESGDNPRKRVKIRCRKEWAMFQSRLEDADKQYFAQLV